MSDHPALTMGVQYLSFQGCSGRYLVRRVGLMDQLETILIFPTFGELQDSYLHNQWVHETESGCIWKTLGLG